MSDDEYSDFEYDYAEDLIEKEMLLDNYALSTIQGRKAMDIFWERRERQFCLACHPMIYPDGNDYDLCDCILFNHFVGKRWLCIPCFLNEEVEAINKFLPNSKRPKPELSSVAPEVSLNESHGS